MTKEKCYYCERIFTEVFFKTIDHLVPKSKGGNNNPSNLVDACFQCNHWKGDMLLEDWLDYVEFPLNESDRIFSFFPSAVIPIIIKNIKKADKFVTENYSILVGKWAPPQTVNRKKTVAKIAKELAWPDSAPISTIKKKPKASIPEKIYISDVSEKYTGIKISETPKELYSVFINTRMLQGEWVRDFSFYKGDLTNVDFENDWRFLAIEGKRKLSKFIGTTEAAFPLEDELIMNGWHRLSMRECIEWQNKQNKGSQN